MKILAEILMAVITVSSCIHEGGQEDERIYDIHEAGSIILKYVNDEIKKIPYIEKECNTRISRNDMNLLILAKDAIGEKRFVEAVNYLYHWLARINHIRLESYDSFDWQVFLWEVGEIERICELETELARKVYLSSINGIEWMILFGLSLEEAKINKTCSIEDFYSNRIEDSLEHLSLAGAHVQISHVYLAVSECKDFEGYHDIEDFYFSFSTCTEEYLSQYEEYSLEESEKSLSLAERAGIHSENLLSFNRNKIFEIRDEILRKGNLTVGYLKEELEDRAKETNEKIRNEKIRSDFALPLYYLKDAEYVLNYDLEISIEKLALGLAHIEVADMMVDFWREVFYETMVRRRFIINENYTPEINISFMSLSKSVFEAKFYIDASEELQKKIRWCVGYTAHNPTLSINNSHPFPYKEEISQTIGNVVGWDVELKKDAGNLIVIRYELDATPRATFFGGSFNNPVGEFMFPFDEYSVGFLLSFPGSEKARIILDLSKLQEKEEYFLSKNSGLYYFDYATKKEEVMQFNDGNEICTDMRGVRPLIVTLQHAKDFDRNAVFLVFLVGYLLVWFVFFDEIHFAGRLKRRKVIMIAPVMGIWVAERSYFDAPKTITSIEISVIITLVSAYLSFCTYSRWARKRTRKRKRKRTVKI